MTVFPGMTVFLRTIGVFEKKEVLNNYVADGQRTTALAVYKASVEKKWGGVLAYFVNYFKYLLHYVYPFKIKLPAFLPGVATCRTPAFAGVTMSHLNSVTMCKQ